MSRLNVEDAVALALFYNYTYSNKKRIIISLEKVMKYRYVIDNILSEERSESFIYEPNKDDIFFGCGEDESGNVYYFINNLLDEKEIESKACRYLEKLPDDILYASLKNRSLDVIGLTVDKFDILPKNSIYTKKRGRYYDR